MKGSDNNPANTTSHSSIPNTRELWSEALDVLPSPSEKQAISSVARLMQVSATLVLAQTIETASHRIAAALGGQDSNGKDESG